MKSAATTISVKRPVSSSVVKEWNRNVKLYNFAGKGETSIETLQYFIFKNPYLIRKI